MSGFASNDRNEKKGIMSDLLFTKKGEEFTKEEKEEKEKMVNIMKKHCGVFAQMYTAEDNDPDDNDPDEIVEEVEKELNKLLDKIGCLEEAKTEILTGLSNFFHGMSANDELVYVSIIITKIDEDKKIKSAWVPYPWMNAWCEIHMDNTIKDIEFFEIYYLIADYLNFPTLQFLTAKKICDILSMVKIQNLKENPSGFLQQALSMVETTASNKKVFSILEKTMDTNAEEYIDTTAEDKYIKSQCLTLHKLFEDYKSSRTHVLQLGDKPSRQPNPQEIKNPSPKPLRISHDASE